MPTIIDSLILELGLDPAGITKGRKKAAEEFLKTKEDALKAGKEIESAGSRAATFFSKLRSQVIGLYAAFTAGRGLKDFIKDTTHADANVGYMAKSLGLSAEKLVEWQAAAKAAGGSAEGITGSLQDMTQQIQTFSLTGESQAIPWLRSLGVGLVDTNGKLKDASTVWLDVAGGIERLHLSPERATTVLKALGADQGMINLLLRGKQATLDALKAQEGYAKAVAADTGPAQERQANWENFIRSAERLGTQIETALTPALVGVTKLFTIISTWFDEHPKLGEAVFLGMTAVVTALTIALAAGAVGLGAITGPIAAIALAITGLGAAALYLYDHWNEIGTWWHNLWSGMADDTDRVAGKLNVDPRKKTSSAAGPSKSSAYPATASATGAEADIQKLMAMGWSREQATGIVANLQRESGRSASAVGDSGTAYGMAQWHPDRQAAFKRWSGHDIKGSTRDEQLAFINYELRSGTERKAGKALSGATDAGSAAAIISKMYERPAHADKEATLRASIANALTPAPASNLNAFDQMMALGKQDFLRNESQRLGLKTSTTDISIGEINIKTAATDAEGIARDIKPAIERNTFANQANYGAN